MTYPMTYPMAGFHKVYGNKVPLEATGNSTCYEQIWCPGSKSLSILGL